MPNQSYENQSFRGELLHEINNFALDLALIDQTEETIQLICDRVRDITNAFYTALSIYNPEGNSTSIKQLSTTGTYFKTTKKRLKKKLTAFNIQLNDESLAALNIDSQDTFIGSYPLILGGLPKTVSSILDKMFNIGYTYGVSLNYGGKLLGTLLIGTHKGTEQIPHDILQIIANISSASLQKIETQVEVTQYQDDLKNLTKELVLSEENERKKTSEELDENVTFNLNLLNTLIQELDTSPESSDGELYNSIEKLLEQSIHNIRKHTFSLSPPVLHELGLEPSLEWLTDNISKETNISCVFKTDGTEKLIDAHIEVFLFQAVRGIIQNPLLNEKGNNIFVTSSTENQSIVIKLTVNFAIHLQEENQENNIFSQLGIFSIQERIKLLGGNLENHNTDDQQINIIFYTPMSINESTA